MDFNFGLTGKFCTKVWVLLGRKLDRLQIFGLTKKNRLGKNCINLG